jgi:hypothetical protein
MGARRSKNVDSSRVPIAKGNRSVAIADRFERLDGDTDGVRPAEVSLDERGRTLTRLRSMARHTLDHGEGSPRFDAVRKSIDFLTKYAETSRRDRYVMPHTKPSRRFEFLKRAPDGFTSL